MDDLNYFLMALMFFTIFFKIFNTPDIVKKKPSVLMLGHKIIYTDQKDVNRVNGVVYSQLLYSAKYNINGKPDYIFKKILSNRLTPVELKSGEIRDRALPNKGDLMQLAAYFLIIEDLYGCTPKKGRLIYKDAMFIVKNTMRLRREVLATLRDMREMLDTGEDEAAPSYQKCRNCICRTTVCKFQNRPIKD